MEIDRRHILGAIGAPLLLGSGGMAIGRKTDVGGAMLAQTRHGPVRGRADQGAIAFKAIPYGASTSGAARFMPPSLPRPWAEPLDAWADSPASPQSDPQANPSPAARIGESEDCLKLNVWTPAIDDGRKRPVMVWLHGGGLWRSSAAGDFQSGARLAARHDVVMVSSNHRLGVLGFAWLEEFDPHFKGSASAGMLDIVLALQWVRDNIEQFGGDPGNVTIFGQSGGGQKVSLLMAMPAAQGLFHKAVIQSGPAPLALEKPYARKLAARLLQLLDIPERRARDLQSIPIDQILSAYHVIFREIGGFGVMGVIQDFAPVVDGAALPQHPFWNGASPLSRGIPLMLGSTRTEMTQYLLQSQPDAASRNFEQVTAQLVPIFGEDAQRVVAHYRASHPQAGPWETDALIRSDWPTRLFTQRIADEKAKQGGAPVWMYRMDWETSAQGGLQMAPHAIDIPFVLDTVGTSLTRPGQEDEQRIMAARMCGAWVSFARHGRPHSPGLPEWRPYDRTRRPTMLFNVQSRMADDPGGADLQCLKAGLDRLRIVAGGISAPASQGNKP